MNRTKGIVRRLTAGCIAAAAAFGIMSFGAFADASPEPQSAGIEVSDDGCVYLHKVKIAKQVGKCKYKMLMQKNAHANGAALNYLINNNEKKTILLPKGTCRTDRAIRPGSNTTIIAAGTTVYQTDPQNTLMIHDPTRTDQKSVQHVRVKGGTWKIAKNDKQLRSTSTFRFNFASDIQLSGCKILTNYRSHAVELIACKNVKVLGCKLITKGKPDPECLEEALQIDLSTKATAPSVAAFGSKFVKGQTCSDITVKNCTISGGRGICANKTDTEGGRYLGKYHRNIRIIGCKITGITSEAVALHNAVGVTVKDNTIISKGSRTDTVYSIGLNVALFKNNGISAKYKNVISGNTIKGGRQALYMGSYCDSKYGTTLIKNNKLYCKKGKANALLAKDCKKLTKNGNQCYKW